jgi:hypothetical protein
MRHFTLLALMVFTSASAHAALKPIDAQEQQFANLLVNPGFENGSYGWTASGGATKTANTTAKARGNYGYDWDSSSAGQTLVSSAITVPEGLKGRPGTAWCLVKAASGAPTHTISVDNGTTDLDTAVALSVNTSQFIRQTFNFVYPTSGSVRLKFTSVAANEPEIYVDSCYFGEPYYPSGLAGSDWKSYSLTITGSVSNPTKGTIVRDEAMWRRIGDSMQIIYNFKQSSAGTSGSGDYLFALPSGYLIDTAKLSVSTTTGDVSCGPAAALRGGVAYAGYTSVYDTSHLKLLVGDATQSTTTVGGLFALDAAQIYNFQCTVPIAGWNSNVQLASTSQFKISSYLAGGTRVTGSAPTALGQYRSYLRQAAASTLTETNGSPTASPSVTDGMRLYNGNAYANADTNNEPTSYDIFVGKNKTVYWQFYASAGRTGFFGGGYFQYSSTASVGYMTHYDPTTGLASIRPFYGSGSETSHTSGYAFGAAVNDPYFDLIVSENALAVGLDSNYLSSNSSNERIESAKILNNGSCSITSQSGSWLSGVTWTATGRCTINITAGMFSSVPRCTCTHNGSIADAAACQIINDETTTVLHTYTSANAAGGNAALNLMCMGPR